MFNHFTREYGRKCVLNNLMWYGWLLLATEKLFKQTNFVSYSMNIDKFMFYYLTSGKSRQYLIAN